MHRQEDRSAVPPAEDQASSQDPPLLDDYGAYSLAVAQGRLTEQITMLIDDVVQALMQDEAQSAGPDPADSDEPIAWSVLLAAGRQREARSKERRRLAEDMVFSALRNLGNPDWRELDDENEDDGVGDGNGDFLRALLQWDPPQPA